MRTEMTQLKRDLCICQAKLSGANCVTLPMLRQEIEDAHASAAHAQVCDALDQEIRSRVILEADKKAIEAQLHEAQEEGHETWRRLHCAVECAREQHATAATIAAERDEALTDLENAVDDLDATEERYAELQASAARQLQIREHAIHYFLDIRDEHQLQLEVQLADSQAALEDSKAALEDSSARVARRDAQLAALSHSGLSAQASRSQQVRPAKAPKPQAASPAKAHPAADPQQPATPRQLTPRQRTAGASSNSV